MTLSTMLSTTSSQNQNGGRRRGRPSSTAAVVKGSSDDEDKGEFEVGDVVEYNPSGHYGQEVWRVEWKGFGPDEDTWEGEENLQNCPRFHEKMRRLKRDYHAAFPSSSSSTTATSSSSSSSQTIDSPIGRKESNGEFNSNTGSGKRQRNSNGGGFPLHSGTKNDTSPPGKGSSEGGAPPKKRLSETIKSEGNSRVVGSFSDEASGGSEGAKRKMKCSSMSTATSSTTANKKSGSAATKAAAAAAAAAAAVAAAQKAARDEPGWTPVDGGSAREGESLSGGGGQGMRLGGDIGCHPGIEERKGVFKGNDVTAGGGVSVEEKEKLRECHAEQTKKEIRERIQPYVSVMDAVELMRPTMEDLAGCSPLQAEEVQLATKKIEDCSVEDLQERLLDDLSNMVYKQHIPPDGIPAERLMKGRLEIKTLRRSDGLNSYEVGYIIHPAPPDEDDELNDFRPTSKGVPSETLGGGVATSGTSNSTSKGKKGGVGGNGGAPSWSSHNHREDENHDPNNAGSGGVCENSVQYWLPFDIARLLCPQQLLSFFIRRVRVRSKLEGGSSRALHCLSDSGGNASRAGRRATQNEKGGGLKEATPP